MRLPLRSPPPPSPDASHRRLGRTKEGRAGADLLVLANRTTYGALMLITRSASLIGRNVTIARSELKPRAYRFMVGDSSEIEVL